MKLAELLQRTLRPPMAHRLQVIVWSLTMALKFSR
jgi:hypothetical protein